MKKFLKYSLYTGLVLAILGAIVLFLTPFGKDLRVTAAEIIMSSQHRHWAKYTMLPKSDLDRILERIQNPRYENTNTEGVLHPVENAKEKTLTIKLESIEENYGPGYFYKGKVLEVSNPKNVKLVSSSLNGAGEQIFVQAKRVGAIAATNASGFVDPNGVGNGGIATGIVIEDGVVKKDQSPNFVAAITEGGKLISGKYTAQELLDLDVKYAAGFKPQLIVNGKKMVDGDGGWGIGPRTAIGQKKDGTIVMVVIDGRQPTRSIGATIEEVQNIMYDRGVINAMAMDGGSSASMYFNGENITTPSSVGHIPRYLPNIWAVIPDKEQKMEVYIEGEKVNKDTLNY